MKVDIRQSGLALSEIYDWSANPLKKISDRDYVLLPGYFFYEIWILDVLVERSWAILRCSVAGLWMGDGRRLLMYSLTAVTKQHVSIGVFYPKERVNNVSVRIIAKARCDVASCRVRNTAPLCEAVQFVSNIFTVRRQKERRGWVMTVVKWICRRVGWATQTRRRMITCSSSSHAKLKSEKKSVYKKIVWFDYTGSLNSICWIVFD